MLNNFFSEKIKKMLDIAMPLIYNAVCV